MPDRKLVFSEVRIKKADGYLVKRFPEVKDLGPNVNIITGANASGKTTLSRTMCSLLGSTVKKPLEADCTVLLGDTPLFIETSGTKVLFNGTEGGLPDSSFSSSNSFPLSDFMQDSQKADDFLEKVSREMSFGIDMKNLREEFRNSSRKSSIGQTKEYKKAAEDVRAAGREYAGSGNPLLELEAAESRLAECTGAMKKLEEAEKAKLYAGLLAEKEAVGKELESYPPYIGILTENTYELLEEKRNKVSDCERKLGSLCSELEKTQSDLNATGFTADPAVLRKSFDDCIRKCENLNSELSRAKAEAGQKRARYESLCKSYPFLVDAQADELSLQRLESLCIKSAPQRGKIAASEAAFEKLETQLPAESVPELENMRDKAGTGVKKPFVFAGLAAVLICVISILLKAPSAVSAAFAVSGMILSVWAVFGRKTGIDSVEIARKLALHADYAKAKEEYARALEDKKSLSAEFEHICSVLNIEFDALFDTAGFFKISDAIKDVAFARSEFEVSEANEDRLEKSYSDSIGTLCSLFGKEGATEYVKLKNSIDSEIRIYERLRLRESSLKDSIKKAADETEAARYALKDFFVRYPVGEISASELRESCFKVPSYAGAVIRLKEIENKIGSMSIQPQLCGLSSDELDNLCRELKESAGEQNALSIRVGQLRSECASYTDNQVPAKAQLALKIAYDNLYDEFRRTAVNAAGECILAYLETSNKTSALLQRASALFETFTGMGIEVSGGKLVAVKTGEQSRSVYTIGQLSSGTKTQFLIAVRLAAVEQGEKEVRYPVFFDETLSNSDGIRSFAIASTIAQIGRERQLFYFTARQEEACLIEDACKNSGTPCVQISLDSLRQGENR